MENITKFLTTVSDLTDLKNKILEKGIIFTEKGDLIIMKYDKTNPKCNLGDDFTSYCRGLVVNKNTFEVVCIPPEKAYKYSELIPIDVNYSNVVFEEFYDGTMINVWFYNGKWNISTRSKFNAECKWHSNKTFKDLFYEALEKEKLDLELLNKEFTHSFVLQHNENRIVKKYDSSSLVLVNCVDNKNLKIISNDDIRLMYQEEGLNIKIAEKYNFNNMEEIMNHMNSLSYESQGVVAKYNNYRTKIRNQNYNFVKVIRGNTPKLFTHYIDLRQKKLIKQYLYYYPEFKKEFDRFNDEIKRMVNLLHHCYVGFHINKKDPTRFIKLENIPYELRPLIYELHGHYLKSQKQIKITREYVKNYFNNLPVGKIVFVINYQKNQKKQRKQTN